MLVGLAIPTLFAQIIDVPVARVELYKVDVITQKQLKADIDLAEKTTGQTIPASQRKQYLDAKVGEYLVNQAAEHDKVTVTDDEVNSAITKNKDQLAQAYGRPLTDDQFHQIIAGQGISWDYYTTQIRQQLVQDKYIQKQRPSYFQNVSSPSDADIQHTYDQYATQFTNPAMVRFSDIFIDTRKMDSSAKQKARQEMDNLSQSIRTGQQTFDDLMKKSVDDPTYTGVDRGYLIRNNPNAVALLGNDFIDKVFSMNVNDVSGVLTSNSGYHIVKVTDKRAPKLLTINDPIEPGSPITVKDYIRQILTNQSQQQAFAGAAKDLIDALKKKANIKIYEENLNW